MASQPVGDILYCVLRQLIIFKIAIGSGPYASEPEALAGRVFEAASRLLRESKSYNGSLEPFLAHTNGDEVLEWVRT